MNDPNVTSIGAARGTTRRPRQTASESALLELLTYAHDELTTLVTDYGDTWAPGRREEAARVVHLLGVVIQPATGAG